MEDRLITLKTAKLAQNIGFDIPVYDFFENTGSADSYEYYFPINYNTEFYKERKAISRPTQSLLARWLRDKKRININIDRMRDRTYSYLVYPNDHSIPMSDGEGYKSYEACLERALQISISVVNENKKNTVISQR